MLNHSSNFHPDTLSPEIICWFTSSLVGQGGYGGGWFTFAQPYDIIDFGVNITYEITKNIPVPFIPNDYDLKFFDPEYFDVDRRRLIEADKNLLKRLSDRLSYRDMNKVQDLVPRLRKFFTQKEEKQILNYGRLSLAEQYQVKNNIKIMLNDIEDDDQSQKYRDDWKGSHLFEGVRGWKAKGYKRIQHPVESYADYLAIRMVSLGFTGYISCDECEVFLAHPVQLQAINVVDARVSNIIEDSGRVNNSDKYNEILQSCLSSQVDRKVSHQPERRPDIQQALNLVNASPKVQRELVEEFHKYLDLFLTANPSEKHDALIELSRYVFDIKNHLIHPDMKNVRKQAVEILRDPILEDFLQRNIEIYGEEYAGF